MSPLGVPGTFFLGGAWHVFFMKNVNKQISVKQKLQDIENLLKNKSPNAKSKFPELISVFEYIGAIVAIVSLIIFFPRISVYPGQPLDTKNPFNNPFIVKNDGYLPLRKIEYSVGLDFVETKRKVNIKDIEVTGPHEIFHLGGNDQFTIMIDDYNYTIPPAGEVDKARILINLKYQPWFVPIKFKKHLNFETKTSTNEEKYWYPL